MICHELNNLKEAGEISLENRLLVAFFKKKNMNLFGKISMKLKELKHVLCFHNHYYYF